MKKFIYKNILTNKYYSYTTYGKTIENKTIFKTIFIDSDIDNAMIFCYNFFNLNLSNNYIEVEYDKEHYIEVEYDKELRKLKLEKLNELNG